MEHALDIAGAAGCESSCPSCVGPVSQVGEHGKADTICHSKGAACLMADLPEQTAHAGRSPQAPCPRRARGRGGKSCYRSQATFHAAHLHRPSPPDPGRDGKRLRLCLSVGSSPGGDILFLDTETTGIWPEEQARLRFWCLGVTGQGISQWAVLMRDYRQESELCARSRRWRGAFSVYAFNRRTFDAPLLASRFCDETTFPHVCPPRMPMCSTPRAGCGSFA